MASVPRSRKRRRAADGGGNSSIPGFDDLAAWLMCADAHGLLQASRDLRKLQTWVEKRLARCTIDCLTPHEVVEFVYRRWVRVPRIERNDFEADDDREASSSSAGEPGGQRHPGIPSLTLGGATASTNPASGHAFAGEGGCLAGVAPAAAAAAVAATPATAGDGAGAGPGAAAAATGTAWRQRQLVARVQVGRDRLEMTCCSETAPGLVSRYVLEIRSPGALMLRCMSGSEATEGHVDWAAWGSLRRRFDMDRRLASDFARSVVLLGAFGELQRRFARAESDSEDDAPGIVTTLSVCSMMAAAVLPASEGRLVTGSREDASSALGSPTTLFAPGADALASAAGAVGVAATTGVAGATGTTAVIDAAVGDVAAAGATLLDAGAPVEAKATVKPVLAAAIAAACLEAGRLEADLEDGLRLSAGIAVAPVHKD